jgi:hypothetical protein
MVVVRSIVPVGAERLLRVRQPDGNGANNSAEGRSNMARTPYFDLIDVLSLAGMIAMALILLTFGSLP